MKSARIEPGTGRHYTLKVLAISSATSRRETGLEPVWGCGDQGGSLRGEDWKGLAEGEAECDEGRGAGKGLLFPGLSG